MKKALLALDRAGFKVVDLETLADWYRDRHTDSGDDITYTLVTRDDSDYRLQPTSPAINAGTTASAVSFTETQTDYFGNTYFHAPYDRLNIGADQAGSDAAQRPTTGGVLWR